MTQNARLYLVDTSALVRAELPQVRYTLQALITDRVAATCVLVDLAAGYSGRDVADVATIAARRRERYVTLPLNEEIATRAREVQLELARAGTHRAVGILDLLTAAVAEHHDAVLLHYAAAFEVIGAITGQSQLWVAARGSLEAPAPTAVLPPAPPPPPPPPVPALLPELAAPLEPPRIPDPDWPQFADAPSMPTPAEPAPRAPFPTAGPQRPPGRPTIDEFLAAKRARDGGVRSGMGRAAFESLDPVARYAEDAPER